VGAAVAALLVTLAAAGRSAGHAVIYFTLTRTDPQWYNDRCGFDRTCRVPLWYYGASEQSKASSL
jgi:hypothetical protein